MKDLLNSLTDGNRVSAVNSVKRTMLYGPDAVQYGNGGTQQAITTANMQQQDCGCNKQPMHNGYDAQARELIFAQIKKGNPQAQK